MANTNARPTELPTDLNQWVETQLKKQNFSPLSGIETVTDQPWSRVWRLTTDQGSVYCKWVAPFMKPELALTSQLWQSHPDLIAEPLALNSEKGWLLIADAGPMMRHVFTDRSEAEPWFRVLADYARMQIDWMEHSIPLRSLGLPDRSVRTLADQVEPLIDHAMSIQVENEADQLRPEHRPQLEALLENWPEFADSLYPGDLSDTLNHGDLHDGNIAWTDDQGRIFDWGDASLSHPFMSMRTVLATLERRFGVSRGHADLYPYIQAYLAPWKAQMPDVPIDSLFAASRKAWPLVSLLSWHHAIQNRDDERSQKYDYAIPGMFREFLAAHANND